MQQQRVVSWLAQHNFPHGMVSFAEGLSTEPLRHKASYLRHLQTNVSWRFVMMWSGYNEYHLKILVCLLNVVVPV